MLADLVTTTIAAEQLSDRLTDLCCGHQVFANQDGIHASISQAGHIRRTMNATFADEQAACWNVIPHLDHMVQVSLKRLQVTVIDAN